jgi:thioredoxin reductase
MFMTAKMKLNDPVARQFDVIIVGGSYAGLAAAMSLGRALKQVLVIDSGMPCNRQTPFSHNFLTQDGKTPLEIAALGKQQVMAYPTISFFNGVAEQGRRIGQVFEISVSSGETFNALKLIFATGIRDIMPDIDGFASCWGISVLHCPYCHGYEVKNEKTGIFANGEDAYEFARLISNWTNDLTVFTNGSSTLTKEQRQQLEGHGINIVEKKIAKLEHIRGYIQHLAFQDGSILALNALYARNSFEQHCGIPKQFGCDFTEEGYIHVDQSQETTISGVFAAGDNVTRMRAVASAVAMGTMAGAATSRKLIMDQF